MATEVGEIIVNLYPMDGPMATFASWYKFCTAVPLREMLHDGGGTARPAPSGSFA